MSMSSRENLNLVELCNILPYYSSFTLDLDLDKDRPGGTGVTNRPSPRHFMVYRTSLIIY